MLKVYIAILTALVVILVLYIMSGISLPGQNIERILCWIWLITTPFVIVKYFKQPLTMWYLGTLFALTIASLIPMGLPMISLIAFAISNDDEQKVENYRLREGSRSAIAIPKIYVIKDQVFWERRVCEFEFEIKIGDKHHQIADIDEIRLSESTDSLTFKFIVGGLKTIRSIKQ